MFSLRSLLLAVCIAAIGAAALINGTFWWTSAIVSLTLCMFTFGLLRVYSHPEKRRFWVPTSLIGWLYLVAALFQPLELSQYLPTSRITWAVWYPYREAEFEISGDPDYMPEFLYRILINDGGYGADLDGHYEYEFQNIATTAHCLTALFLAFVGGASYSWSLGRKARPAS